MRKKFQFYSNFKHRFNEKLDLYYTFAQSHDYLFYYTFGKNKKEINRLINETLEEILLHKNSSPDFIKGRINNLSLQFSIIKW